jgi:Family of unknown function (DUF6520)
MKRSKIFLSATTCILAIAGFAASRAHRTEFTKGYYFTSNGAICKTNASIACKTLGSGGGAHLCTQASANHHTLFTKSNCTGHKLYTLNSGE